MIDGVVIFFIVLSHWILAIEILGKFVPSTFYDAMGAI